MMVSELCLGTMTFGRELGEEGSKGILTRFLESGGTKEKFYEQTFLTIQGIGSRLVRTRQRWRRMQDDELVTIGVWEDGPPLPLYRVEEP